jgi:hypothetical protein
MVATVGSKCVDARHLCGCPAQNEYSGATLSSREMTAGIHLSHTNLTGGPIAQNSFRIAVPISLIVDNLSGTSG